MAPGVTTIAMTRQAPTVCKAATVQALSSVKNRPLSMVVLHPSARAWVLRDRRHWTKPTAKKAAKAKNAGAARRRTGGIARNDLMVEILASVLNRPLDRLVSSEGTALGAAVAALAGLETHLRRERGITDPYAAAAAVAAMAKFRDRVAPRADWVEPYRRGLAEFERRLR